MCGLSSLCCFKHIFEVLKTLIDFCTKWIRSFFWFFFSLTSDVAFQLARLVLCVSGCGGSCAVSAEAPKGDLRECKR